MDEPDSPRRVDDERVAMLRALGREVGQELLAILVDTYESQAPARLRSLREAAHAGDRQLAGELAHALKGASSNVGAAAVATMLDVVERAAGRDSALVPLLAPLEAELPLTLAELRRAVTAGG